MAISVRPEHLLRYKDIAALLVKHARGDIAAHARAGLDGLEQDPDAFDADVKADADALAKDLEGLGPTFVKLGQLLSTRADLFPPPYLEALGRLQDACEPVPYDLIAGVVEAEIGARLSNAFAEFSREPLAAASLGQVHRARLRSGKEVAVKVQRPDIRDRINDDLEAIAEIAGFVDRHTEAGRRFGFGPMVAEFSRSMLTELDYRREAANLEQLGRNLADLDRIVVPQPVADYSTGRVLTMDFIPGRKVTSLGPLALMEIDGPALADQLFEAYLKQILEDGFFHADPHPGNVSITDDGRLALLDLGMVGRLTPDLQDRLIKLLLAIGEGDGGDAATAALELGTRRDDVSFEEEEFRTRIEHLVAEQGEAGLGELAAGAIIAELSRISGECGLRPAAELTMLGKALLNLDEVARTLAPEFSPAEAIRDKASRILQRRVMQSVTPGRLFAAALDAKEFTERLPGRVNKVMDALAEGELTLNVEGIDEHELLSTIRTTANRLTMGLVLAALIIGASQLMRVDTADRLLGYPALAIICFLAAAFGGLGLLAAIVWGDRKR
jgi:ubiquinone biosynthesis protein